MNRTMRASIAPFAGALALVLSAAAGAHAQQQPDAAPLTEVQQAAVKRLNEILELINSGDYAKTRAYFEANSADIRTDVPGVTPGEWHRTAGAWAGMRRVAGNMRVGFWREVERL